ncbi:AfsR/SARP family transcriptional regulator [Chitiniphilus eburneus]|uniref:AfsR/SARP family transcriptional regulator n=1 Tax=Chitiniphilus eburneus TaxID=2571148 RepID=UPI001FE664CD|nr:bacterial transcriptional activator domain-containing protein [Chitiniphilus eburneus]
MLHLFLFGSLSVQWSGAPCAGIALSSRAASLLAFLALARGRFFSRAELATLLWTDRGEAVNAGTFNTALWRLRKAIERPPIAAGTLIGSDRRGGIGLLPDAALTLDVEQFQQLTAPGLARPLEQLGESEISGLRAGVQLYKADILSDFTDDWALREREKLRRIYLNAQGRLMKFCGLVGDHGGGIRHAQAILDCDALREDVHRELMRLYVLNGQRALALRQFEYCRGLLRRELAIHPMPETVALYRRIAESAIDANPRDAAPATEAPIIVPPPAPAGPGPQRPTGDPRLLLETARRHLAEADVQLQMSLRLFDD